MSGITSRAAREMLRRASEGQSVDQGEGFAQLQSIGALSGTPDHPVLTTAGAQGLRELDLRAYRADAWTLDEVLAEAQRVSLLIDATAKDAEFFLTTLGPITPPEALPYLRIVATGLANRRHEPEDLVEQFRNVWGSVEVIGGDARDRLVAAELLEAAGVPMTEFYAPMVSTVEQLRANGAKNAVTAAAILHLDPERAPRPPIEEFREARRSMPTDEMAAVLAMVGKVPEERGRFERFRSAFSKEPDLGGGLGAALYLAVVGADPDASLERIRRTALLLSKTSGRPLLLASLITHGPALRSLSPEELVEWVNHAAAVAKKREIAASPSEFEALGVALVEGLPPDAFGAPPGPPASTAPFTDFVTLLALHAWVYRGILDPEATADLAAR